MKRPLSLTIVAAIWFLFGVVGVVGDELQTNRLQIPNYNLINILVGVGLLSGWRISRWYATCAAAITFAFMLVLIPWALFNTGELVYRFPVELIRNQRPHEATSLAVIILVLLGYLLVSGWMCVVLQRRDVRELFQPRSVVTN